MITVQRFHVSAIYCLLQRPTSPKERQVPYLPYLGKVCSYLYSANLCYSLLAMSNDFLDILRFLAVSSALAIYISKPWDG